MLKQILLVGLGGGIGSILRFLTSLLTDRYNTGSFPFATFTVNIVGCFLMGLFLGAIAANFQGSQNLKLLLLTGFCGGYTTFSAFASENFSLFQNHNPAMALIYIASSILTGLFALWIGMALTR